jgi:hypothetical protein
VSSAKGDHVYIVKEKRSYKWSLGNSMFQFTPVREIFWVLFQDCTWNLLWFSLGESSRNYSPWQLFDLQLCYQIVTYFCQILYICISFYLRACELHLFTTVFCMYCLILRLYVGMLF